ncbi:MAG: hypothetical protein V1769_04455 [Thermoplasmatota archaeon]
MACLLIVPSTFAEVLLVSTRELEQYVGESNKNSSNIHTFYGTSDGYILDQSQIHTNNHRYSANGWYLVQSFKPSLSVLAKIDLLLELKGYGNENEILELSIKEKLDIDEPSLAMTTVSYSDFNEKEIWAEFLFDNVTLVPDKTYFIYLYQKGFGDCYWYGNYNKDYYERGYAYGYNIGLNTWENLSDPSIFPDFDFCFKTYSYGDNNPPEILDVHGPLQGKPKVSCEYNVTVSDDEHNQIFLFVDWDDGTTTNWIGPYNSSKPLSVNHTWMKKGSYTLSVRAKDDLGNMGDWYSIEVSMPRTMNPFFLFEHIFDVGSLCSWIRQIVSAHA